MKNDLFRVAAGRRNEVANNENPADEYAIPGGDPEIMKEVCDKLFPPGEVDWQKFWKSDDYDEWHSKFVEAFQEAGGYDPSDPERAPSSVEQMEWLTRATDYLKTREDFGQFLPYAWESTGSDGMIEADPEEEEMDILGDEEDRPWNREMSAWDLRAMMEKRRYREKSRAVWRKRQAAVGGGPSLDILKDDVRISDEDRALFELTDEEAWYFITQGGQTDPAEVMKYVKVMDPEEKIDFPGMGVRYIEEVDEFLKRKGHWTTQESDLTSKTVTLEGEDYDDFQDMVGEPASQIPDRMRMDSEWEEGMVDA